jgi:hypothetical protein
MSETCQLTVGGTTISASPATRAIAEHWLAGFPDYRFDLLDLIAEGDKVVARMPFSGTQAGPGLDLTPTGGAVHAANSAPFQPRHPSRNHPWSPTAPSSPPSFTF